MTPLHDGTSTLELSQHSAIAAVRLLAPTLLLRQGRRIALLRHEPAQGHVCSLESVCVYVCVCQKVNANVDG